MIRYELIVPLPVFATKSKPDDDTIQHGGLAVGDRRGDDVKGSVRGDVIRAERVVSGVHQREIGVRVERERKRHASDVALGRHIRQTAGAVDREDINESIVLGGHDELRSVWREAKLSRGRYEERRVVVAEAAGVVAVDERCQTLESVIAGPLARLMPEETARRLTLQMTADDGVHTTLVPASFQRVVSNLLANAIQHTPPGGSVHIRASETGRRLFVVVEDTGEGLPAGAERPLFEPFWRGDRARSRRDGGTGLGLAFAEGLVEGSGGQIWAENRPDGGASASFTIPTSPDLRPA